MGSVSDIHCARDCAVSSYWQQRGRCLHKHAEQHASIRHHVPSGNGHFGICWRKVREQISRTVFGMCDHIYTLYLHWLLHVL